MRPIVFGTDFSPAATEAAEVAAALAKRGGAKLLLLHVAEFRGVAVADPVLFEAVLAQKRAALEGEAARLRNLGVMVEHTLLSGSVFEELVNTAADSHAQLLVVGAVGHGLARRLLIGSVAERVAQTSTVPTLVVRPGSTLVDWSRGDRALKILLGYDFSEGSDAALRCARSLQLLAHCEFQVTHIDWHRSEEYRLGFHGAAVLPEDSDASRQMLQRDLAERVVMILPGENVAASVLSGWQRADAHLLELANRGDTDLLLVGSRAGHRLHIGSAARALLHRATTSVCVARSSLAQRREPDAPRFERVLVATDFANSSSDTARYACALLQRGGELKIIHVTPHSGQAPAQAANAAPDTFNPKMIAQLRSLVPRKCAGESEIEVKICFSDDPAEAIAKEAEQLDADMICIDAPQRNGEPHGDVLQRLIGLTSRPVLVLQQRSDQ